MTRNRWLATLVLLAGAAIHWPIGEVGFAFDDHDFIEVNASIRSVGGALAAFGEPFPPDQPERALYRPVTNLSYAIDHALYGDAPRGYHVTNVLLYMVLALLVHRLALLWLRRDGPALAAALLFCLHPVHTGAVDALAGRSELLALVFGVGAILLFVRGVRAKGGGRLALALSLACYALACLSKESGAMLPAILAVHVLCFERPPGRPGVDFRSPPVRALLPFAALLLGDLALRVAVLGRFGPEQVVLADAGLGTRVLTMGAVFFGYLRLLVFPSVLQVDYYYHDVVGIPSGPTLPVALGLLAGVAAAALLIVLLARELRGPAPEREGPLGPASTVGLAFFVVYLLPVSHLLDVGALMAERFLLAPSLGFVILLVDVFVRLPAFARLDASLRRAIAVALLVPLCVLGGARSVARAEEWRDPVALWRSAHALIPWDTRVGRNLAVALMQRGDTDEAETVLRALLERAPGDAEVLGNLGAVQLHRGDYAAARDTFTRLVAVAPGSFVAWNNLGIAEAHATRHATAVRHYRRALELNPNYVPAAENLAESERIIRTAREYLSRHGAAGGARSPEVLRNLAAACVVVGDDACAARYAAAADDDEAAP